MTVTVSISVSDNSHHKAHIKTANKTHIKTTNTPHKAHTKPATMHHEVAIS